MRPKGSEPPKRKHWNEESVTVLLPKDTKEPLFIEIKELTGQSATAFMRLAALELAEQLEKEPDLPMIDLILHMPKANNLPTATQADIMIEYTTNNSTRLLNRMAAYSSRLCEMNTKEKYAYLQEYQKTNYDRTKVWFPTGKRQIVSACATKINLSLSRFILYAVLEKMENDFDYSSSCLSSYLG